MVINTESTDEQFLQYMIERQVGDPIPDNVKTDMNPFSAEPSSLPDMLYLCNLGVPNSHKKEGEIREAGSGYWKMTDSYTMPTAAGASGCITKLEYYEGKAPAGKSTGWMMHQYQADRRTTNAANSDKEDYTLCRVFLQNDSEADGAYVEKALLEMLEQEDNSSFLRHGAKMSQFAGREHDITAISSKTPQNPVHETAAETMSETSDFLSGDYLELNDLYSPGTSSGSSDDSSRMTVNSDDYFDPDTVLMDLQDEWQAVEEHHHLKLNISTVAKSDQVFARPPSPGSIEKNEGALVKAGTASSTPNIDGLTSCQRVTADELKQNIGEASTAGRFDIVQANQIADSSNGGKTPRKNVFMSVSKITRLRKKYCCFGAVDHEL